MTGELEINGQDAYSAWGVGLEDGALSELMAYPAVKEWITNESRLENGTRYTQPNLGDNTMTPMRAAREITLPMHITAKTREEYLNRHGAFFAALMLTGDVNIRTKWQLTTMYRCKYLSCTQFTQYHDDGGGIIRFALRLVEPNPNDGDREVPYTPIGGNA